MVTKNLAGSDQLIDDIIGIVTNPPAVHRNQDAVIVYQHFIVKQFITVFNSFGRLPKHELESAFSLALNMAEPGFQYIAQFENIFIPSEKTCNETIFNLAKNAGDGLLAPNLDDRDLDIVGK